MADVIEVNVQTGARSERNYTADERANIERMAAEEAAKAPLTAIRTLERQVTQRRLREAALTDEGKAWLQNIEDQIAAERARAR